MNEQEITALAREYGEYVANSLDYDMCSDPELRHILAVKGHSESAQSVLEWLLRRFCLVEKDAIRKEYKQAAEDYDPYDPMYSNRGELDLLESLFPDLGKEVEE